ncbi:MAG: tRNA (N6-threonylcarbamoyladenosine(37)-N6)-methyltransferase TrmO [Prevotella sp.]|nr:tRNA (N6-threonylcarbamoyladenosine(37)-N6)-methyltransferase TrmO [Prevotella sp.]
MEIQPIGFFRSPFAQKFGIPRQSGLVEELEGEIFLVPEWRKAEALRGLEDFDYVWLIWGFSEHVGAKKSATVRPPLLGGNRRMGVFATRSPFRPNNLGLSSVRLSGIDYEATDGPVVKVLGADLMDGTPIYDLKPYLPYVDSHPDARGGFTEERQWNLLNVKIPDEMGDFFTSTQISTLKRILELDPRPHYHDDAGKEYGLTFCGVDIRFRVEGDCLKVIEAKNNR